MADASAFDFYFQKADLDRDGKVSGMEAIQFFKGTNLPQPILAKIWHASDQGQTGFLSRAEFHNALKLVTVAQSGRELTQEIIKAALVGPASQKIPAPKIDNVQPPSQASLQQATPRNSFTSQPSGLPGSQVPSVPTQQPSGLPTQHGVPTQPTPRTSFTSPSQTPVPQAPGQVFQMPRASYNNPQMPAGGFTQQQNPRGSFVNQRPIQQAPSPGGFGGTDSWPPARPSIQGQLFTSAPTRPVTQTSPVLQTGSARPSFTPGTQTGGTEVPFGGDTFSAANLRPVNRPQNSSIPGTPQFRPSTPQGTSPQFRPPTPQGASPQFRPSTPQGTSGVRNFAPAPVMGAAAWPKMTTPDVQRYSTVFSRVDTDKDGKITGVQARDLFSSWGLPREVLKQVWDLSDQDGDSMLSFREFCTALYMMERFKEGRPLPPVLPAGFHFDDTTPQSIAATRLAEAQAAVANHNAGFNLPSWQQNQRMQVPGHMGIAPGRAPMPGGIYANKPRPNTPSQTREEAPPSESDNKVLDSKEKLEFYRNRMQEIVLFKRKCDNRLTEITDRAASEKREEESMTTKYDEKYKQALETNARLVSEEAAARELQVRKSELLHAITEIDRGGNANALLQTRSDRISNDLDELEKALVQRGQLLGFQVKGTQPIELPFGWQPGLQVNAAEWDENWDKFDDEGFTAVQDIMDQPAEKAGPVPAWDESSMFTDGFDFSSEVDNNVHELDETVAADSPRAESETSSLKSGLFSPKQDLWSPKSSPGKSPLSDKRFQRTSEDMDAFPQRPSFASSDGFDHGPSFDSGDHPDEQPWESVFTAETNDDVRASWGLQNDSSNQGFDSLDFGSLKISTGAPSEIRNDSNGWMDNSTDFSVPSTPLFKTDSPTANTTNTNRNAFFDESSRLNSFASTIDESDPFAGTGPFGGTRSSSQWSTF